MTTTASNRRVGSNHKLWFTQRAKLSGSTPHFLASTAAIISGSEPTIAHKTMTRGGSSSQLARGWADLMIATAAASVGADLMSEPAPAAARAFDIASRLMGLGRKSERVGKAAANAEAAQPGARAARFIACLELDSCRDTKAIFAELARAALRGKADASHLGLHASYGRANGYRGTHMLVSIDELLGADLRVESSFDERGSAIHVFATIDGARHNLVSFKRKGGDGPSERYPDQMQATLLARGARAAGAKMASTVARRDTGRSIVDSIVAQPMPDWSEAFA